MNHFHALTIAVGGTVEAHDWDASNDVLLHLQDSVDGDVDVVHLAEDLDMWVNEEGIIRDMPINVCATVVAQAFMGARFAQPYFGPVVVTGGGDADGETLQLSEAKSAMVTALAHRAATLFLKSEVV